MTEGKISSQVQVKLQVKLRKQHLKKKCMISNEIPKFHTVLYVATRILWGGPEHE